MRCIDVAVLQQYVALGGCAECAAALAFGLGAREEVEQLPSGGRHPIGEGLVGDQAVKPESLLFGQHIAYRLPMGYVLGFPCGDGEAAAVDVVELDFQQ